jgi:hypothetical protein
VALERHQACPRSRPHPHIDVRLRLRRQGGGGGGHRLETPSRPTAATQAYAFGPGRVAHSREALVCRAVVDGHPVPAGPGLALGAPLASRRALSHLLILHRLALRPGWGAHGAPPASVSAAVADGPGLSTDRGQLEGLAGLPEHVRTALRAALREEAARRVCAFLRAAAAAAKEEGACGDRQGGASGGPGHGAGGEELSAVQRMFRGIRGPWVLNLTEEALADLRTLRRSQASPGGRGFDGAWRDNAKGLS